MKRVVLFVTLLAIAVCMFILPYFRTHVIITAVLFPAALMVRACKALSDWHMSFEIIAISFVLVLVFQITGMYRVFFVTHIITLAVFYGYIVLVRKFASVLSLLRTGRIRDFILMASAFAVIPIVFLMLWFFNQTGNPHEQYLPNISVGWLLPLGIGLALLNGLYEEGIYRGLLFPAFENAMGFILALVMQAVWFSFLHYQAGSLPD